MAKIDPYAVLGLARDATEEDIKAAFRNAAKTAHPDVGGTNERFALVTLANRILSDKERRAAFDATGEIGSDNPDTADATAVNILTQLLMRALMDDNDLTGGDLRSAMIGGLEKALADHDKQLAVLARAQARLRRLEGRWSRRVTMSGATSENLMERLTKWQAERLAETIKGLTTSRAQHARAAEIIRDHDFRYDPPMMQAVGHGYFIINNTTSAFGR